MSGVATRVLRAAPVQTLPVGYRKRRPNTRSGLVRGETAPAVPGRVPRGRAPEDGRTLAPVLITGMIIVEYVFQTNGIGRIYFGSVAMRDYTRVLACAVLLAILIMP